MKYKNCLSMASVLLADEKSIMSDELFPYFMEQLHEDGVIKQMVDRSQ